MTPPLSPGQRIRIDFEGSLRYGRVVESYGRDHEDGWPNEVVCVFDDDIWSVEYMMMACFVYPAREQTA